MRAPRTIAPRLALIGDAAHAIHPLSATASISVQGCTVLAQVLVERPDFVDCGDARWLRRYERARIEEVVALQSATHALQRLFQPHSMALAWLRNSRIEPDQRFAGHKRQLVRYALG